MTQDQKVNTLEGTNNPEDWDKIKKTVKRDIDTSLNTMMILKAQVISLVVNDGTLRNFSDIRLAWQNDN